MSVGSGIFPVEDLGKTDAQEFLYFGRHWLKAGHAIKARAKSLITLLTTAVSIAHATFGHKGWDAQLSFDTQNPQSEGLSSCKKPFASLTELAWLVMMSVLIQLILTWLALQYVFTICSVAFKYLLYYLECIYCECCSSEK